MIKNENEILQFWEYNERGKVQILHARLMAFLESKGFANAKISDTEYLLVKKKNNRMSMASAVEVDQIIKQYLIINKLYDVFETYAKGIGSYVNPRKFNLLNTVELVNDRDKCDSSNFYFKNCFCQVTKNGVTIEKYENLKAPIWENRIIDGLYFSPNNLEVGQFEEFCKNISGNSEERFIALKTILGFLLHRNKEVGEAKAIILYDEKMGHNNQAHGGTGKTLLSQAIAKCREVEIFDGKEIKAGSWFKNQRIELTTDVLVYDDLNKEVSLENFYAMITSGIEVEKKRKQSFFIKPEDSPKILITSNYPVKGPGGSSDERRRHEFELSNYYDATFTPEMDFGNRFFGNSWDKKEWSKFYQFMMVCVQDYLKGGLVKVDSINLNSAKICNATNSNFFKFAKELVTPNKWQDKREFQQIFKEFHPEHEEQSAHSFYKWLETYAISVGGELRTDSTGGAYNFMVSTMRRKEVKND